MLRFSLSIKTFFFYLFSSRCLSFISFVPDAHPIVIHFPLPSSSSLTLKQFHSSPPPTFILSVPYFSLSLFSLILFHRFYLSCILPFTPSYHHLHHETVRKHRSKASIIKYVTACSCFIESCIQTHD
jgi:hypothetical protein